MRRCSSCKETKSLEDFYPSRRPNGRVYYSQCKVCAKASVARWQLENPRDPEKERERLRNLRKKNPEKDREYGRRYREKNRERSTELARLRSQRYRKKHPEKYAAAQYERRQLLRMCTQLDADYIAVVRSDPCSYCGSGGQTVDHIEPFAHGGHPGWENMTAACGRCNSSKKADSLLSFLLRAA